MSHLDRPLPEILLQTSELALGWVERAAPVGGQAGALRHIAIRLCASIREGTLLFTRVAEDDIALPALTALVGMSRGEIVALANRVTLAVALSRAPDETEEAERARFLGALALSYAQENDLPCVAALLRIGIRLGIDDPWLEEAQHYLVDQQQPDGRFGLLSAVLRTCSDGAAEEAILRLQVEILWALNEIAAARATECYSGR